MKIKMKSEIEKLSPPFVNLTTQVFAWVATWAKLKVVIR